MQAHLVQQEIVWEDRSANHDRVRTLLDSVSIDPGDLIVLPEMFDSGFSFNTSITSDESGVTLAFLTTLARERGVHVHGSRTLIGPDGKGRNMATVVSAAGEVLCEYAKIHPFSYGREAEFFEGGNAVVAYDLPYTETHDDGVSVESPSPRATIRVSPAICYDLRFPELFRAGLELGAEMFTIGANWPSARTAHWRALLIARAIENQAIVLGANRAGRDPHLEYAGGTIAVGPRGEILGELADREGILSVEIAIDGVRAWRAEFGAWRDRRTSVLQ